MANLVFLRDRLRDVNLHDTEYPPLERNEGPIDPHKLQARTLNGTWNDLEYPMMGSVGRSFGRNVQLPLAYPETTTFLDPNPRLVSTELLTRHQFIPATSINLLAAAWIQFQVHDWFVHDTGRPDHTHAVPRPPGDTWPHDPITIPKTPPVEPTAPGRPPAFANLNSHWWDASQLYGNNETQNHRLRTFSDGKIKVGRTGLLEVDPRTGEEITGFLINGWIGVSMLHGLFALEHNAICDHLKARHGTWNDDQLHQTARLITAALLAKIHTLEWTTAVLDTKLLELSMSVNWYGLLGRLGELTDAFEEDELLNGIIGSVKDHHTAPYAMTEEFVSVYRMHPLMPDEFTFRSLDSNAVIATYELPDLLGTRGRPVLERHAFTDLLFSLGTEHPGAITIQNYPKHLQNFRTGGSELVDLATVEIVRDRERGVPRYNAFRVALGRRPIATFSELTPDRALATKLESIYRDVNRVDTLVGLLTETPPKGFAFSDTAFRVFILMASRRLKSDRFFTTAWREDIYTREGIRWVQDNTMASVLRRHFPDVKRRLGKRDNAFQPWDRD